MAKADASEDELLTRFNKMTLVVATQKLEQLPQWVKVSEVFKTDSDAPFLRRAGISGFDDPRYEKYSQRLARLLGKVCRMSSCGHAPSCRPARQRVTARRRCSATALAVPAQLGG